MDQSNHIPLPVAVKSKSLLLFFNLCGGGLMMGLAICGVAVCLGALGAVSGSRFTKAGGVGLLTLFVILMVYLLRRTVQGIRVRNLLIEADGVRIKGPSGELTPWAEVIKISEEHADEEAFRKIRIKFRDRKELIIRDIDNYEEVRAALANASPQGLGDMAERSG